MKRLIPFITLLFVGLITYGQDKILSDETTISIITCSPGYEIYSMYGHTAIRVKGKVDGKEVDWIYNYGTFEFTDDFAIKFATGETKLHPVERKDSTILNTLINLKEGRLRNKS